MPNAKTTTSGIVARLNNVAPFMQNGINFFPSLSDPSDLSDRSDPSAKSGTTWPQYLDPAP